MAADVITNENPFIVKLVEQTFNGQPNPPRVVFYVTPDISESQSVNYNTIEPVHMPGQIFVYKNTTSRNFSLSNIKLVSRTTEEAETNLRYLWQLRAWTKPRFGINSQTLTSEQRANREIARINPNDPRLSSIEELRARQLGAELLGAPPAVLLFSAYSAGNSKMEHIRRVPTVIQSLSIPYPSDVDYIMSTNGVPMPTIMTIDITLAETHSPREYERFSLDNYRNGILPGF